MRSASSTKKKRGLKKPILILVILAMVAGGIFYFMPKPGQEAMNSNYIEAAVTTGDLTQTLSAGGTLEPADSYTVTTLVDGDILADTFEEGDTVAKDDVLYTLDSSDMGSNIEKAELSLASTQRNYQTQLDSQSDLSITSPIAGTIYSLNVSVGDQVMANQVIGQIRDNTVMEAELYFLSDEVDTFYVGQTATLMLDNTFEELTATITHISALEEVLSGNQLARMVTFSVTNNGGLSVTHRVSGEVGAYTSLSNNFLAYVDDRELRSDGNGTVSQVYVEKGDNVSVGQTLVLLESDTIANSIQSAAESVRNAELSLEDAKNALDNYNIQSPISGTVIEKHYKAGETISSAGTILCTIYDLSHLTMTLNIDELEILTVQVGQTVEIESDSVRDAVYYGTVTKVSQVGTTVNSMTSYPVTVEITDFDGLLSGMNVNATIVTSQVSDAILVPIEALQRGNYVLVTPESPSAATAKEFNEDGYAMIPVVTGISDDTNLEITQGLVAEDIVVYAKAYEDPFAQMMGMMGSDAGMNQMRNDMQSAMGGR